MHRCFWRLVRRPLFLLFALPLTAPLAVRAATAPVDLATADAVARLALERHPGTALDRARVHAAQARTLAVDVPPALEVGVEAATPALPFSGGVEGRVSVARPLVRAQRLRAAHQWTAAEVEVAEAAAIGQARLAAGAAVAAWRTVIETTALTAIAEAEVGLLAAARGEAERAAAAGELPIDRVHQLRLDEATSQARLEALRADHGWQQARLRRLLDLPESTLLQLPDMERLPERLILPTVHAVNAPDSLLAAARLEAAHGALDLARQSLRADPTVEVFVEREVGADALGRREHDHRIGVGFTFPWLRRNTAERVLAEPRAALRVAEAELATTRHAATRAAAEAAALAHARHRQATTFARDLLPLATARRDHLLSALALGETDPADLLDARRQLLAFVAEEVRLRAAALQAIDEARLAAALPPFSNVHAASQDQP